MTSTFLSPSPVTQAGDLASFHLRRDQSLPTILSTQVTSASEQGYAEGVVTNTRFGSFPHSTIIGVPWGSQIRASKVDTGSRGRVGKNANAKKRKLDGAHTNGPPETVSGSGDPAATNKQAEAAESGFIHVLPPTPENWTTSLPHRTQVVYTPDYSYILHRIRARPGSRLIEAGSGSGSFTHAAARAVFSRYPGPKQGNSAGNGEVGGAEPDGQTPVAEEVTKRKRAEGLQAEVSVGRVFTYEYHRERHEVVKAEMSEHGLESVVHAMHRDVYSAGFLVYDSDSTPPDQKASPRGNAIFLDLPAPWEALPHLTRESGQDGTPSVLDPENAVQICTFSPCIEQVQKTVSALRRHDWIDIEAVEMQHKRIEVRREHTGLQYDGMRGANAFAADVGEAVARLKNVEQRVKDFHAGKTAGNETAAERRKSKNQQQQQDAGSKLPFNEGKLVHRTEPDLKTHTSYLVFATLPRAWTEDDEAAAQEKWSKNIKISPNAPKSQRQIKKEAKLRGKGQKRNGIKNGVPGGTDTPMNMEQTDKASG